MALNKSVVVLCRGLVCRPRQYMNKRLLKRAAIEEIKLRLQRRLDSFLDGVIEREEYTAERARLMSRKKTLEEQKGACAAGRADWLEPFRN
ncbi:MAG: hypothetical protein KGJ60_00105 [Verrucomicrobiota bacterium]|nr:hypothetical protein [Verrucomicrobiota bacterium]